MGGWVGGWVGGLRQVGVVSPPAPQEVNGSICMAAEAVPDDDDDPSDKRDGI